MKQICIGDKYQIQCYKHNGKVHRAWDEAVVLAIEKDYIVFGNDRTQVIESSGNYWRTKEPAVMYFFKNKWFNIGRPLTEHEFYQIIRRINNYLAEDLINGNDVIFPNRMGKLELRKRNSLPVIDKNGNLKVTYAIDWDNTLKLWYEDEEAFNNKTLVRLPERNIFRIKYNKNTANYNNKSFMEFQVNRNIKTRLKQKIKNNEIDAFNL